MSADNRAPDSGDDPRLEKIEPSLPRVNQDVEKEDTDSPALHPAVYVVIWISLSSSVILFNKWILDSQEFRYPVLLTAWHLFFATVMTQIMARTTSLLDGRKNVRMNTRIVAFIQMLKATTPVAVLVTGWFFGVQKPNMRVLFNVSFIVIGVVLASFGEIKFVMIGFLFQCGGIMFEAVRLVMVQRLLNSPDSKMDPLVSLYYFAPVCTVFNGLIALAWEVPKVTMPEIHKVGLHNFALNAMVAFALNVSVVFLIGKTSSLVLTLCGVLKDILLVAASMMIWGTIVTPLQFIGYAIALGGLVYYKLGGEQVRTHMEAASQRWRSMSSRRPLLWRVFMFIVAFCVVYMLVGVLAPSYAPKYDPEVVSAAYMAAKERYKNGGANIPKDD
ncbi:hypothetical protein V495_06060 [Pseudogymnoascus sp. VKM F-4514 (FW-929)]|nr:hypothetical protein V495_06060 [Pseudogymnoascus sp. VKM F-4514 (FW-929)]KFY60985.1 hypothetical protein V497_03215 [Pseudogymnoascus sp. VKM F-4516 (FW-969)]